MAAKTYSIRPPVVAKEAALEMFFRVEMKRDDIAAEGLKVGDAIAIVSQGSGKSGGGERKGWVGWWG